MASAWGESWGSSWEASSWGTGEDTPVVPERIYLDLKPLRKKKGRKRQCAATAELRRSGATSVCQYRPAAIHRRVTVLGELQRATTAFVVGRTRGIATSVVLARMVSAMQMGRTRGVSATITLSTVAVAEFKALNLRRYTAPSPGMVGNRRRRRRDERLLLNLDVEVLC